MVDWYESFSGADYLLRYPEDATATATEGPIPSHSWNSSLPRASSTWPAVAVAMRCFSPNGASTPEQAVPDWAEAASRSLSLIPLKRFPGLGGPTRHGPSF